jgi:hypothetical protein
MWRPHFEEVVLVFRNIAATSLALAVAGSVMMAAPAHAQAKEQVVFSGEAEGSFGEVGFWIWCAVDEQGAYDDCAGAMAFDDLKLTKHVEGEVSEPDEDVYEMEVASSDGSVACTLINAPPISHGPRNTVDVTCSSPSGTASTDDAVVVATG